MKAQATAQAQAQAKAAAQVQVQAQMQAQATAQAQAQAKAAAQVKGQAHVKAQATTQAQAQAKAAAQAQVQTLTQTPQPVQLLQRNKGSPLASAARGTADAGHKVALAQVDRINWRRDTTGQPERNRRYNGEGAISSVPTVRMVRQPIQAVGVPSSGGSQPCDGHYGEERRAPKAVGS